jgi:hypothetical protein
MRFVQMAVLLMNERRRGIVVYVIIETGLHISLLKAGCPQTFRPQANNGATAVQPIMCMFINGVSRAVG